MSNPANNGTLTGRLTRVPKFFDNADGSKKMLATISVEDDYKSGPNKEYGVQHIDVEYYVPARLVQAGGGILQHLRQGQIVGFSFHLESQQFEKNGQTQYRTVVALDSVKKYSSRTEDEAREAAKASRGTQAQGWGDQAPQAQAAASAAPQGAAPTGFVPDAGTLPQNPDVFAQNQG